MPIPVWVLLGFAAWTLLILFATVGVYRWSRILYQVSESLTPAADSRIGIYLIHHGKQLSRGLPCLLRFRFALTSMAYSIKTDLCSDRGLQHTFGYLLATTRRGFVQLPA